MNKIKKEIPWQMSTRDTRISNVGVINVAHEEK